MFQDSSSDNKIDQYLYTGDEKTDTTNNSHQKSMKSKQGKEVNCLWWSPEAFTPEPQQSNDRCH